MRRLQDRLVELGYMTAAQRASGPGIFGPATQKALRTFQGDQNLPPTGVVDATTAERLANPLPPPWAVSVPAGSSPDVIRDAVRQKAVNDVLKQYGPILDRLPLEERNEIYARAQERGDQAVREYDRLYQEELGAQGGIRNLPPEDRAAVEQAAGEAALRRYNPYQRALYWSQQQMNPVTGTGVNSNNGLSVSTDPKAWNNWCLAFVSTAYGRQVPELRAASAIESYRKFEAAGKIHTDSPIPAGAPVFFAATSANGGAGHIAIATGRTTPDGDPIIRTSGWRGHDGITEMPLSELERITGRYLGWGDV